MKTAELTGAALDWAVATANGGHPQWDAEWGVFYQANGDDRNYSIDYSTNWLLAGPIIEREGMTLSCRLIKSYAMMHVGYLVTEYGDTPLIAAMRCYVASKLGNEVDVPQELL